MSRFNLLAPLALALTASAVVAQAPIYIDLPPGSNATDVTIAGNEIVVVGTSGGTIFRWTQAGGLVSLGQAAGSGNVRVSADGTRVGATTTSGGLQRASYWSGGVWTPIPGLGATSGTFESSCYDISGDGQTIGGLAWVTAGSAHCISWTAAGGTVDLGGLITDPSSRANAVNGDGSLLAGWKDLPTGERRGAIWQNGVITPLDYIDPNMVSFPMGEAFGCNTSGSIVVGFRIFGGANVAWRWDTSTGVPTLLQNLPNETTTATAFDLSDDGSVIVGHSGGNAFNGTKAVIWINDVPQSFTTYLTGLGTQGISNYPDLGFINAVSNDGNVFVGKGSGLAVGSGQPSGGWIVIMPGAQRTGTTFCSGDGTATACPCGNTGVAGHGCASSVSPSGAQLFATGAASLASDTLVLHGSGMPDSSALYFQGTTQVGGGTGAVFGDGLRCAGGTVIRLKTVTNASGASQYPGPADASVSVKGQVAAPGTRTYQLWYRNAASFCTPSTFNLTNGLEITWGA